MPRRPNTTEGHLPTLRSKPPESGADGNTSTWPCRTAVSGRQKKSVHTGEAKKATLSSASNKNACPGRPATTCRRSCGSVGRSSLRMVCPQDSSPGNMAAAQAHTVASASRPVRDAGGEGLTRGDPAPIPVAKLAGGAARHSRRASGLGPGCPGWEGEAGEGGVGGVRKQGAR